MPGPMCEALVCAAVLIIMKKSMAEDSCDFAVFQSWLFILSVPLSLFPSIYLSLIKSTVYGGNSRARKAVFRAKQLL